MAAKLSGGGGRYAARQNADINVTPFVDILMVLLVIFMVAVPTAVTSLKVDLPPPSFDKPTAKPVVITIQNSGALYLAGQATKLDALSGDLAARFKADHVLVYAAGTCRLCEAVGAGMRMRFIDRDRRILEQSPTREVPPLEARVLHCTLQ